MYELTDQDRAKRVEDKRREMPCLFKYGISFSEFEDIAYSAARTIKRIKNVNVSGAKITCTVESNTGYTDWEFYVDFNNWGHITGVFWGHSDNTDSPIYEYYGKAVSRAIHELLDKKGICLIDYSDFVDKNRHLELSDSLDYIEKKTFVKRLFGKKDSSVCLGVYYKKLIGEHLYPVISLFISSGFKNIKTVPIKDIDYYSDEYRFEVESITIGGVSEFSSRLSFQENEEVVISYHEKKTIIIPWSMRRLKGKDKDEVGNQLRELGFLNIYMRAIDDLLTGWIVKEDSIEKVLIGENEEPMKVNSGYSYDEQIVMCYHTKKF